MRPSVPGLALASARPPGSGRRTARCMVRNGATISGINSACTRRDTASRSRGDLHPKRHVKPLRRRRHRPLRLLPVLRHRLHLLARHRPPRPMHHRPRRRAYPRPRRLGCVDVRGPDTRRGRPGYSISISLVVVIANKTALFSVLFSPSIALRRRDPSHGQHGPSHRCSHWRILDRSLTDFARSAGRCGFRRPHSSLRAMILFHTVADLAGGVYSFAGRRRTPHSDGSRDA